MLFTYLFLIIVIGIVRASIKNNQMHGGYFCAPSTSTQIKNNYNEFLSYHQTHQACVDNCKEVDAKVAHVIYKYRESTHLAPYGCFCYAFCNITRIENDFKHTLYHPI